MRGTSAAPGIARGVVCLYTSSLEDSVPHYSIASGAVQDELKRLRSAFDTARNEMGRMVALAKTRSDSNAADIFTTHLMMLNDKSLIEKAEALVKNQMINAEHAVSDAFDGYIKKYEDAGGHFAELTHDFIDVRNRVLSGFALDSGKFKCEVGERGAVIVASKRLTPSMVLNMEKANVLAFVTREGGITSHAVILARSFGVPVMFGIDVENELDCGMNAVVDASAGKVIVSPDRKTTEYYDKKLENNRKRKLLCDAKKDVYAKLRSGQRVSLKINITTPDEMELVRYMPHDGIGLLRTEFLFINKKQVPTEEEQFAMYSRLLSEAGDKSVTVRLLDLGGDKLPLFIQLKGDPFMEYRGAMAVEAFPELYMSQARALLRANMKGNLRILFPMVSDVGDLKTFKDLIEKASASLKKEGRESFTGNLKCGIMVETPGAVMLVDELLKGSDFINIGSNDLLQYTLAAARGNPLAEKRYHIMHPALLKLLEITAVKAAKSGKEVCLCGEIASFEEFYPLLLETGLKSFSVSPAKFNDIKCELMHRLTSGKKTLQRYYKMPSKAETEKYIEGFLN